VRRDARNILTATRRAVIRFVVLYIYIKRGGRGTKRYTGRVKRVGLVGEWARKGDIARDKTGL